MEATAKQGVQRRELVERGETSILESGFLSTFVEDEQEMILSQMEWHEHPPGATLTEINSEGHGVHLIVRGQVLVEAAHDKAEVPTSPSPTATASPGYAERSQDLLAIAHLGAGHLIGERSVVRGEPTSARVVATSKVRALHISVERFQALMETHPRFREQVNDLIDLRERWPDLLSLVASNSALRALGQDDAEILLQSARIIRMEPGDTLVRIGDASTEVFLVVAGRLGVYATSDDNRYQLHATLERGRLTGEAALLLETSRTADLIAEEPSEVLSFAALPFMEAVQRNPQVYAKLLQALARTDLHLAQRVAAAARGRLIALTSTDRVIGTTSLAYGLAASMSRDLEVTLVDAEGDRSQRRLPFPTRTSRMGEVEVTELEVPSSWGFKVLWPRDPKHLERLVDEIGDREDRAGQACLVAGRYDRALMPEVIHAADDLVVARTASHRLEDIARRRGQACFHAIRPTPGVDLPLAISRKSVRFTADKDNVDDFWSSGDLTRLTSQDTASGRASGRLERLLRGRSVGVALGGGGALGYAHIGLLRELHAAGLPVDFVSGVSFGSLVGALYVAGGLPLLERLLDRTAPLEVSVLGGMFFNQCYTWFVRSMTKGAEIGSTEIPFFPLGLDLESGKEFILSRGTLADAVTSSSCLPGLFPVFRREQRQVVDGGMINNVPVSVTWDAGADFIIGSNCIPPNPAPRDNLSATRLSLQRAMSWWGLRRMDQLARSLYMLMSQIGRDRSQQADFVFDLEVAGYNIYDFDKGRAIADAGQAQARKLMPRIRTAYEDDLSIRF